MNPAAAPGRPWSRARWARLVAFILGVQLLLVFALSERRPVTPRQASAGPGIRLVLNRDASERWQRSETVQDPTLFALANQRGFSGRAWLRNAPGEHPGSEWGEPPQFLGADVNQLASPGAGARPGSNVPPALMAGKPAPRLQAKAPAQPPLARRTTLKVEGRLAERRLLAQPPLPAQPAAEVLAPTTVEAAFNGEGDLVLARCLPGRGVSSPAQKQADQQALDLAKAIRFEPLSAGLETGAARVSGLTWGRIIFQWQTVEAVTPAPAATQP